MDIGKLQEMMAKTKQMKEEMDRKLADTIVEGSSGGGMVLVTMNGQKQLLKLTIDPSVASANFQPSDVEMLEDLITAAVNDAARKADEASQKMMQGMMGSMLGGLSLPGLF